MKTKLSLTIVQCVFTLIIVSLGAIGVVGIFRMKDLLLQVFYFIALFGMIGLGLWWIWFNAPETDDEAGK
jgi:hypothetical protein